MVAKHYCVVYSEYPHGISLNFKPETLNFKPVSFFEEVRYMDVRSVGLDESDLTGLRMPLNKKTVSMCGCTSVSAV